MSLTGSPNRPLDNRGPEPWSAGSWRDRPVRQMPVYPDPAKLAAVEGRLRR